MKYHPAWRYWGLSTIGCLAVAACSVPAEAPAPEQPKAEQPAGPGGDKGDVKNV